jgi:hypothetical protein
MTARSSTASSDAMFDFSLINLTNQIHRNPDSDSDVIIADADKQFVVREFKQYAGNMKIAIKTISVETHHSIEMMKRYHDSLR